MARSHPQPLSLRLLPQHLLLCLFLCLISSQLGSILYVLRVCFTGLVLRIKPVGVVPLSITCFRDGTFLSLELSACRLSCACALLAYAVLDSPLFCCLRHTRSSIHSRAGLPTVMLPLFLLDCTTVNPNLSLSEGRFAGLPPLSSLGISGFNSVTI